MSSTGDSKSSLSFGFIRKQEAVQLKKSAVPEEDVEEKSDKSKDFVLSLEGKELKSTKSQRENKKKTNNFIIPLIHQNRWRTDNDNDNSKSAGGSESLDLLAAEEVLKDSARLNDEWEEKGSTEETSRAIPLLMQNKIPDGFETDNRLDVKLRPEQPNDADYNQIPIEHFGMAMLRGMGWNESRGVGRHGKNIAPVEAQIRPKGLGLGADRGNDKQTKDGKKTEEKEKSEEVELKKGACCVVTAGANKDLYGIVEGIDEDNSRVMVKLALNGKVCNLMQCNISLVSKKEYDKYSKYLNKQKADKYKEDEERKRENTKGNGFEREKSKRQYSDEESYSDKKHHKHHKRDHHHNDSDDSSSRHSSKHHKHSKKSKHSKSHKSKRDDKYERKESASKSKYDKGKDFTHSDSSDDEDSSKFEDQRPWVQQDLRVRVVDKAFKNFYKEKVVIVDVPSPGVCVCKSSEGRVLDGISQSSLETVIPKDDNSFVLIVSGDQRGLVGQIMKRDKDQCLALVQLLSDRDSVLKLQFDEVCEYVGNVHARDDY